MQWNDGLMKACRDHVKDTGPTGATGHTGVDGSNMQIRIGRYMKWERTIGENIMYTSNTPLQVLTDLAIDDGVSSRGHRRNIFNGAFAHVGIYTGPHKTYGRQTVLDYMGSWKSQRYSGPKLATPSSYMAYKNYASPLAKAGSGGAGGSGGAASTTPKKKAVTPKKTVVPKKKGMNNNHWACNYYKIFQAQADAKKADVLNEWKYEQKIKKLVAANAVRYKKYYIADPSAKRRQCVAMYRAGCRVYGAARTKQYAKAK